MSAGGEDAFIKQAQDIGSFFSSLDSSVRVRVVSHFDCDGISAASILLKYFNRHGIRYTHTSVPHLDKRILKGFTSEEFTHLVFIDLGSGYVDAIGDLFSVPVCILDHHACASDVRFPEHVRILNPHLHGVDGSKDISASGVVYHALRPIDESMGKLSHLAVIGAVGDNQSQPEFSGLNKKILDEACSEGVVRIRKMIRIDGGLRKPLFRQLQQSSNLKIPGVSGTTEGGKALLEEANVPLRYEGRWLYYADLTQLQEERLAKAIIGRRRDEQEPEDIYGYHYEVPSERKTSHLRDAGEYSTVLNACGRMERASMGVTLCLGSMGAREQVERIVQEYKDELTSVMTWFKEHANDESCMIRGDGHLIIRAKDALRPSVIGTLGSMLTCSGMVPAGTVVIVTAHLPENNTLKISARSRDCQVNLRDVIAPVVSAKGGDAGGHVNAAGGLLDISQEEAFYEAIGQTLYRLSLEENVRCAPSHGQHGSGKD